MRQSRYQKAPLDTSLVSLLHILLLSISIMLLHSPTFMPKRKVLPPGWLVIIGKHNTSTQFTIASSVDDAASSSDSDFLSVDPKRSVHFGSVDFVVVSTESSTTTCIRQCSVDAFETTWRRSSKQAVVQQCASSSRRQGKRPRNKTTAKKAPLLQSILQTFRAS